MNDHMNTNSRECYRMPMDENLLSSIGRVAWLAVRLHHAIRDKFLQIEPQSDLNIFDLTLGSAKNKLRDLAISYNKHDIVNWCDTIAKSAIDSRNGLMHSVAITTNCGRQALTGSKNNRPTEYTESEILDIADQIFHATINIPD